MKHFFVFLVLIITALIIISCTIGLGEIHASLPDLVGKPDGVYRGECTGPGIPVRAVVDVIIQNERLTIINIVEHTASGIGKQAERITEQIIVRQSLDVDTVSGATISSKVILKAVENALQ